MLEIQFIIICLPVVDTEISALAKQTFAMNFN